MPLTKMLDAEQPVGRRLIAYPTSRAQSNFVLDSINPQRLKSRKLVRHSLSSGIWIRDSLPYWRFSSDFSGMIKRLEVA